MKRKILVLGFLVLFVVSAKGFAQEGERYQLFQGKYSHYDIDQGTSNQNEELFLLDTTTGDVQVYYSQVKDGKQTKYWTPAVFDESKKF